MASARLIRTVRCMTTNTNIQVVNDMTCAATEGNVARLRELFADEAPVHVRGPLPNAGDHVGVDGFLSVVGAVFARTGGDVKLEQLSCLADDRYVTEFEHALLGRNGKTLDAYNSFVYRVDGGRIAEMWMLCTAPADQSSFWD